VITSDSLFDCSDCLIVADHREIEDFYVDHVRTIRLKPEYQGAVIVLIVENNMTQVEPGRIHTHITTRLGLTPDRLITIDGKPTQRGVHTGEDSKHDYAMTIQTLLSNEQLVFVKKEQSVSKDWILQRDKLLSQLNLFSKCKKDSTEPGFGRDRYGYTGKNSGPDDAAMALQMTTSWHQRIRTDPSFIRQTRSTLY